MSNKIKISRFLGAAITCTFVAFSGCGEMTGDSGGKIKSEGSDITGPTATTGTNGTTSGGTSPYKGTLSIIAGINTLSNLTVYSNGNISGNPTFGSCSGTVSNTGKLTMTCTSSTAGTLSITNGQLAVSGSSITGSGTYTLTPTTGAPTTSSWTGTGTATATTTTATSGTTGTTGTTTGTTGTTTGLSLACNNPTNYICYEFYNASGVTCAGLGGTKVTSCSISSLIGTCTLTSPGSGYTIKNFYYTGGGSLTTAQQVCSGMGGTWSTN